jgi:ABC-2 type transport system permease protein
VPVLILTTSSAIDDPTAVARGLVLVGCFGLTTGVMDCLVTPNLRSFDTAVRRGDLDLVLLRPVHAPAYCLLRRVEPAEAGRAIAGLGMSAVGLAATAGALTAGRMATAVLLAALGVVAVLAVLGQPRHARVLGRKRRADQRRRRPAADRRAVPAGLLPRPGRGSRS